LAVAFRDRTVSSCHGRFAQVVSQRAGSCDSPLSFRFGPGSSKLIQIVTDGDADLATYATEYFPEAMHTMDVMHVIEKRDVDRDDAATPGVVGAASCRAGGSARTPSPSVRPCRRKSADSVCRARVRKWQSMGTSPCVHHSIHTSLAFHIVSLSAGSSV